MVVVFNPILGQAPNASSALYPVRELINCAALGSGGGSKDTLWAHSESTIVEVDDPALKFLGEPVYACSRSP
jgi:hypothetical protein